MDILETAISKPRLVSYKPLVISLVSDRAGGFRGNFSEKHGTGGCCQLEQMIIPRARVHDPDGAIVGKLPGSQISGSVITEISMVITREWKLLVIWEV